jgi:S-DNA-T family DNA segregation ATPase FtsK/SpoIIIE
MFNRYSLSIYENQMITDDVGQLIKTLKHLEQVMIERFNLFATHQAHDIKMYNFNQTNKKDVLPYIVIVIDDIEIDDSSIKEKYHDLILRITQKSRTAGIHVIILTTKPYQNISNQFGYIIPNRLAFRLSQTYDSMALLGTKDACYLRSDGYLCETYKHQIKKG